MAYVFGLTAPVFALVKSALKSQLSKSVIFSGVALYLEP